jgi:lysophospholipase L1-like esterase
MFGGQPHVTIPAGASVVSDPVAFRVPILADVAISLYLSSRTPPRSTGHVNGLQDVYIASGDVSADPAFSGGTANSAGGRSYYFLTNLDVQNDAATGSVVAFGASITDGFRSSANGDRRWPNRLAVRLQQAGMTVGVLNMGISGNNFFTDSAGEAGLTRFDRDALQQPGAKWVIISDDAINNLDTDNPSTAPQLISALQQLIERAHRVNIKVICSTLTPFSATGDIEAARQQVNAFVLSSTSGCDAVLDQAQAVSDPANPAALLPAYDSGDKLHPNDAGLQAIADAMDLDALAALPPIRAPSAGGQLAPGGQKLSSCDNHFNLSKQADGGLMVTQSSVTLWSAGTSGSAAVEVRMQENGNLVTLTPMGRLLGKAARRAVAAPTRTCRTTGISSIYTRSGAV